MELVRSLGADEVIDYKKQEFEEVLQNYDAVLGTVKGDVRGVVLVRRRFFYKRLF